MMSFKTCLFILFLGFTVPAYGWEGIAVHVSDSTHMTKEECNSWHRERGWDSCGYNFVIEPDGTIYEGRGISKVGAHVKGHNQELLGVCFVSKGPATMPQIRAFKAFLGQFGLERLPRYAHAHFNHSKRCGLEIMEQLK